MFGFSLVKTERLKYLEDAAVKYSKIHQLHRWFSGWPDLDIIWDYIRSDTYFGGIWEARKQYAKARHTDEYGKGSKILSECIVDECKCRVPMVRYDSTGKTCAHCGRIVIK